jgi:peptide/nickel transport system substrate-binding protein
MDEHNSNNPTRDYRPVSRRGFLRTAAIASVSATSLSPFLAACSSGNTATSGGGKNAKIIVGTDTDIDDLDPMNFKSDAAYEAVIQTYEMPVGNKVVKQGEVYQATTDLTGLAAQEFQVSADLKTYTLKVRPGLKFTNGNPVDANALIYSYKRALLGPGYASLLMGLLTIKDVSQLRVIDNMTLQIELEKPNPMGPKLLPLTVLNVMDPVVSQQKATSDDPWATKFYRTTILGTGPYKQGSTWQSGSQYMLEPNPDYWDKGKLQNSGVLLKYVPSSDDRLLMLQRGALDLVFGLPTKDLAQLRGNKNVQLWDFDSRNTNYIVLNNQTKPFDDVRVRQAIAYAIPYDDLIKNALHGFGKPLNGVLPDGTPTADSSSWPYKTDPEKAKQLLAAAGLGSGFRSSLAISLSRAGDEDTAVLVQSALAKVGIQLDIQKMSDADFRAKQQAGQLPMFIEYWYSWVNDPFYQMFFMLNSKNKATNLARYANPEFDQVVEAGMYETDEAKRAAASKQGQQIFNRDVPLIMLYRKNFVLAAGKTLQGANVYPDQYLRFWDLKKG